MELHILVHVHVLLYVTVVITILYISCVCWWEAGGKVQFLLGHHYLVQCHTYCM